MRKNEINSVGSLDAIIIPLGKAAELHTKCFVPDVRINTMKQFVKGKTFARIIIYMMCKWCFKNMLGKNGARSEMAKRCTTVSGAKVVAMCRRIVALKAMLT